MPTTISPSSSMLRFGLGAKSHNQTGDRVSYCKKPGHEREEIEGACYQCADTFCKYCIEAHKDHYLIFFQDSYLKNNYESVQQIPTDIEPEPTFDTFQRDSFSPYLGSMSTRSGSKASRKQGNSGT